MTKTPRRSWPSADVWQRMGAGMLMDNTSCPACACPAAMHVREMGVLFCPADADDAKARAKYWDMLKRAPGIPNSVFLSASSSDAATTSQRQSIQAIQEAAQRGGWLRERTPLQELARKAIEERQQRLAAAPPPAPQPRTQTPAKPTGPVTRKRRYAAEDEE